MAWRYSLGKSAVINLFLANAPEDCGAVVVNCFKHVLHLAVVTVREHDIVGMSDNVTEEGWRISKGIDSLQLGLTFVFVDASYALMNIEN